MTEQTTHQFLLPDVGEGLTEADIVTWHVKAGDQVVINQIIVEIETAKSLVELPCPFAGTVHELLAQQGETVDVGAAIISITTDDQPPRHPAAPETDGRNNGVKGSSPSEPKLLVGYGAREQTTARRRRRGADQADPAAPATTRPRAKPPVRKLAEVLGVDLTTVTPSGDDGIIVRADVLGAANTRPSAPASETASDDAPVVTESVPPQGLNAHQLNTGEVTRIPIKGVRKHTAAAMVASAFTAPHVTEFVTVDITATLALRDRVHSRREFRDVKATPLAFVARAYLHALRRTPMANARWDEAAQEIVVPAQVNLGIAAATPRGLVVPNIKGAERLSLAELAHAIGDLAQTARAGRCSPQSMSGGTTTITNVGIFGVDTGTPILNPGESAILAVGAIRRTPWVVGAGADERIEVRSTLQLALSFDHRVLDGQGGSQLLADTAAILTDPIEAFL